MSSTSLPEKVAHLRVFVSGAGGGNPTQVVVDADAMGVAEMQKMAASYGHEAGFVLKPSDPNKADVRYRFFLPRHEMDMCGHATLGTTWLLARQGRLKPGLHRIETHSGIVQCRVSDNGAVAISQPIGTITAVDPALRAEVIDVLGLVERDLLALPLLNASTSRVKTLVPLASPHTLHGLTPDFARIAALCDKLGSTGLYPFACDWDDERTYHARQFPNAAGIDEDAATGVAAAALFYGLKQYGLIGTRKTIRVRQGEAMGCPSRIAVTEAPKADAGVGVWLTGEVELARDH